MANLGFVSETEPAVKLPAPPAGWVLMKDNANNDVYLQRDSVRAVVRRDSDGMTVVMYDGGYSNFNKKLSDVMNEIFGVQE